VPDGSEGQWLLAKARELKEQALATADRTRRNQFLLIATEYQKLAEVGDPPKRLPGSFVHGLQNQRTVLATSDRGRIARLPVTHRERKPIGDVATYPADGAGRTGASTQTTDLMIWTILALIALSLVLIPGDQTAGGLRAVFDLLTE
jgi:hypothetical protein